MIPKTVSRPPTPGRSRAVITLPIKASVNNRLIRETSKQGEKPTQQGEMTLATETTSHSIVLSLQIFFRNILGRHERRGITRQNASGQSDQTETVIIHASRHTPIPPGSQSISREQVIPRNFGLNTPGNRTKFPVQLMPQRHIPPKRAPFSASNTTVSGVLLSVAIDKQQPYRSMTHRKPRGTPESPESANLLTPWDPDKIYNRPGVRLTVRNQ